MTMTLPTLPALPAGYVATAADMNNLAYCATFALTKPITLAYDSAGSQSLSTATVMSWGAVKYDTDGMWSSGTPNRLTVQTSGWYKIRYNVVSTIASTGGGNTYCTSTTGSNNPAGSGVTSSQCWPGYSDVFTTSGGGAGASGIWPFYLYQGDYVQVFWTGSTVTTTQNLSFFSLEFASTF